MIWIVYILALLGSFFIGLFIDHYYPNYMKYKAKNLATKEDIGEITKIVESIKTELANDTEILKAELSLKNQNVYSIKNEERRALIEFHNKYSIWHNLLSKLPPVESMEDIQNINQKILSVETDYYSAASAVTLFFHDEDFVQLKLTLFKKTLTAAGIVDNYLLNRKFALNEYFIEKESKGSDYHSDDYKKYLDKILQIHRNFYLEFNEPYAELALAEASMIKKIKSLISMN